MTLVISKGLTLRKGWQPMDPDAAAYITAVETADTEPLEEKTKIAIDNFVLGCKADGIWSAIKASCILAGARTLSGALVPLVGSAPTNVGGLFVSDDYNRKTGLVGNGSTKYLNSNRANNADPQNSKHIAAYIASIPSASTSSIIIGVDTIESGGSWIGRNTDGTTSAQRANGTTSYGYVNAFPISSKLIGVSRSGSSSQSHIAAQGIQTSTISSATPTNENINVFRGIGFSTFARIPFYSIGESLDLALLDARVTQLMTDLGNAIP
jgi:hypothetical protein